MRKSALAIIVVLCGSAAAHAQGTPPSPLNDEGPFLKANEAAMNAMMEGMAVKPSGDVDTDFSAMMIPHHEGAIAMAKAELLYGRNEQLRRIAQEVIVDQQQEIAAMRIALGQPLPPSVAAPTQSAPAPQSDGVPTAQGMTAMPHMTSQQGKAP